MSVPNRRSTGRTYRMKRRRRPAARIPLKPWIIRIAVVAAALVIGSSVFGKIIHPIKLVRNERRENARIISSYNSLKKQNADLRRRLAYLKTPEGIAQEARKQGFVKPGEVSLVIPDEKQQEQTP